MSRRREDTIDRIRAQAAEAALAEALALNAELHAQLDRANAAAVRMAKRAARWGAALEQGRAA